jgi:hypothetical protein
MLFDFHFSDVFSWEKVTNNCSSTQKNLLN